MLDGIEYDDDSRYLEELLFEESGIVVVSAYHNEYYKYTMLTGAINDEIIWFGNDEIIIVDDDDPSENRTLKVKKSKECMFEYEIDSNYRNFNIMKNGKLYSIGICFYLQCT